MDRTYVALDLETTGLSPRLDRIIEVGAVRFRGDTVIERFESLVRPEVPIPLSVQRLTGIADTDVAQAPGPQAVMEQMIDFVGDSAVVAHSGTFDLSFFGGPDRRHGYELYDTLDLSRILLPMAPSHSLPHLSRQLVLSHAHPHRALSDADAARQLFGYLWRLARGLPAELLDRMLDATRGWVHPIQSFLEDARRVGPDGVGGPTLPVVPPQAAATSRPAGPRDPMAIRALLDPEGPMAARLPDYEMRESQQQMTLAVAQLFQRGGRLMVEAGPGTGKSLAYLLPAVHRAAALKERVVVATNTITLQEQLFHKDIPFLQSWLPFDFSAVLLKGRANYVSLRRWNRYLNAPSRRPDGSWFADEVKFKLRMLVWLAQTQRGDRSEIRLAGLDELFWARAASTADDCLGPHCQNYQQQACFYWNSRQAARAADLVVTNHALLLADALSGGTVLPSYQHLIVDEAHQLEEAAVENLTVRLSEAVLLENLEQAVTWLAAAVQLVDPTLAAEVAAAREGAAQLFAEVQSFVKQPPVDADPRLFGENRVLLDPGGRQLPGFTSLVAAARRLTDRLSAVCRALETGLDQADPDGLNSHAVHELDLRATQLNGLTDLLHEAFAQARPDRMYWLVVERRSGRPLLQVVPTDAGRTLAERVIQDKETVVFTSASLAVADSFDYFRRGVGLREAEAHELILASPFDYLSQALLCLPTDLKELDDPEFLDQTAESVASIARQLEGRTLVLFTAHQQLRDVADRLRPLSAADGVLVMAQNVDGTRRQLLEQFRQHPRTILLGTSSFWQGIDVPGDALSCVVIVRLPFGVPTDPARVARSAGLRDPFTELLLPEAVLRLKQGFGRLIRKRTDRGAVVLLDHRVANRAYGQAFLDALPRAAVHLGLSDELAPTIGRWLEQPVSVPSRA